MHLDALLFISDHLFGKGYYTKPQLKELSESSILRVAMLEEEVVGFFIFKIIKEEAALWMNSNAKGSLLEVKTVAVSAAYQRKGIGSSMFKEVETFVKQFGIKESYCVAWKRGNDIPMHNIHLRNGFAVQKEIENYWYADSIKKQFQCPDCGIPCRCSAIIYQKRYQ